MKKITLSLLLMMVTFFAYSQQSDTTKLKTGINGNNELKLNLFMTIAGVPEINYERILSDDMSIGLAVLIGIDDTDYKFGVIPNYRVYFGGKKANGFFIEGNAAVIGSQNNLYYYDYSGNNYYQNYTKTQTNFGLGAAAGAKFLTKNGFVGEIYLGAGRLFGDNSIEAYPRAGITIGKRF